MPNTSRIGGAGVFVLDWLQALGARAPGAPAAADPAAGQPSQLPDLRLEDLLKLKVDTVQYSEAHPQQIMPQDGRTLTARATWRLW